MSAYDFGSKRNTTDDDLYSGFDTGFSHDPNSQAGHLGRAGLGQVTGGPGHANAGALGPLVRFFFNSFFFFRSILFFFLFFSSCCLSFLVFLLFPC